MTTTYHLAQKSIDGFDLFSKEAQEELQDVHISFYAPSTLGKTEEQIEQIRQDLQKALSRVPGHHRVTIAPTFEEMNAMNRKQKNCYFQQWVDWARENQIGLDMNISCPDTGNEMQSISGLNNEKRNQWIEYVTECRKEANNIGEMLLSPCMTNLCINDRFDEQTVDRLMYRQLLKASLDKIYKKKLPWCKDTLQSHICPASEVHQAVGITEFFAAYAALNRLMVTIDIENLGSFNYSVNLISSLLLFLPAVNISMVFNTQDIHEKVEEEVCSSTLFCREAAFSGLMHKIYLSMKIKSDKPTAESYATGGTYAVRNLCKALIESRHLNTYGNDSAAK